MKKVLILAVAVCLIASFAQASIFSCWLTNDYTTDTPVGGNVIISIWGKLLIDPAVPGDVITHAAMHDMAITISTPGTVGNIVPNPGITDDDGNSIFIQYGTAFASWGTKIDPAVQDIDSDGDLDTVEMSMGTTGTNARGGAGNVGTSTVLLATQNWTILKAGATTMQVYVNHASRHFVLNTTSGALDYYTGYQQTGTVVNVAQSTAPPVISLVPASQKINTSTHGGSTANVSLTVNQTGGDAATAGTLTYGDGATAPFSSLSFTGTHTYAIGTYSASAVASNDGGSSNVPTASVQVVMAPSIVLLVNGSPATSVESGTAFWGHNTVTLSLAPSNGYITYFHIVNPATGLDVATPTWTGDSYSLYGTGGVTFTVGNDASGLSTDQMTVQFIPEPATMALLAIGAVGALIRRKK